MLHIWEEDIWEEKSTSYFCSHIHLGWAFLTSFSSCIMIHCWTRNSIIQDHYTRNRGCTYYSRPESTGSPSTKHTANNERHIVYHQSLLWSDSISKLPSKQSSYSRSNKSSWNDNRPSLCFIKIQIDCHPMQACIQHTQMVPCMHNTLNIQWIRL